MPKKTPAKKPTVKKPAAPKAAGIVIKQNGEPMLTPGKRPLALPTQKLADAVAAEWKTHQKFNPTQMPLTLLAYTAIDRIAGQEAQIVEVLMAYIDTDTLSYRASGSEKLAKLQKEQWDPVLKWAGKQFDAVLQVTSGVMPLEQPEALHEAIGDYLSSLDNMRLAACCILASGYSSLILALAVLKKKLDAEEAFTLSRLEEDTQAEQWGRDPEAEKRAERLKADIVAAGHFLRLLDQK